jgi:UDP-N-acetylmuramate--alanine ligase
MRHFENYKNIYLIGIGGIGMSALARFFKSIGKNVGGYDRTSGPLTDELILEGIEVVFDETVAAVPELYALRVDTLVVYTPAIPAVHPQLRFFIKEGFKVLKRSEVLGLITLDMDSICVAGTHGKTTVSTLVAHLFYNSHLGANAFLGGISKNYRTNFLCNDASQFAVLEADEFDRSFLQLTPDCAVITSMDADHLDIYGTREEVVEGFGLFARRIKKEGVLLLKTGLTVPGGLAPGVKIFSYGLNKPADFYPENIEPNNGLYSFDLVSVFGTIKGLRMGIPGLLNVENAVAAIALALLNGVKPTEIEKALPLFQGIARRFEVHVNHSQLVYIDDYAHHPEEIRATLASIQAIYPGKAVTGVFQPHLYSRTRDFAREFAEVLSELDELVLLPVYPARELPIPGVDSKLIASLVKNTPVHVVEKENLLNQLQELKPEVLVTMGAGDIDRLVPIIKKWGIELANK